jgi:hypothetical protein
MKPKEPIMKRYVVLLVGLSVGALLQPLVACSSDNAVAPAKEAGATDAPSTSDSPPANGDAGEGGAACPALQAFTPPDATKLTAGQLLLTASGEALAEQGYNFPDLPANGVFADGWEVRFQHFIATFDKITLSANPEKMPSDQSKTGDPVAQLTGPWVIDLSKSTPNDVPGKEMGEMATPFAALTGQNLIAGNPKFDTVMGTHYAVGFSSVVANPCAINVNLDAEGQALYADMIAKGCSVLYVGTATFKADPATCTQDPGFVPPPVVKFSFCFKSPTDYINCDNQDTMGTPDGTEPHPRGIVFPNNTYVTGEVTFHTDHPFWESTLHDQPAHFDQFAARVALASISPSEAGAPEAGGSSEGGVGDASTSETGAADSSVADVATESAAPGADASVVTVTLDDVKGVDFSAYTDKFGNPVKWRSCVKDAMGNWYGFNTGPMAFDLHGVPSAPAGGDAATGLRDYYDFTTYNQSTQGHWNGADGLCYVMRNYPSPP